MFSSVLASSVIVISAVLWFLLPFGIPVLGFSFHIPELLSDALFFRRCLLSLLLSVDLPLPCGQIAVVLLHKERGVVIHPFEHLHIGIAVLFQNTGQAVHAAVNLLLCTCNLFLQGLALLALEQPGRLGKLLFQLREVPVH